MKTKPNSPARNIVLAALFLALAFVLPMITGHVPQIGNMLCPMHFPVLLAGFVLGGPWGLVLGFIAPLLRSVLFGMPPLYPIAISMAFELATYGAVSGWMYKKVRHTLPMMYAALATAMVAGRLVWGAVRFVLAGLSGSAFPFSAFLSGALLTAVPGIIAQLILIPLILTALQSSWTEPFSPKKRGRRKFSLAAAPFFYHQSDLLFICSEKSVPLSHRNWDFFISQRRNRYQR